MAASGTWGIVMVNKFNLCLPKNKTSSRIRVASELGFFTTYEWIQISHPNSPKLGTPPQVSAPLLLPAASQPVALIKAVLTSDTETKVPNIKSSGLRGKLNKVVLAYSGGLDSSVIVPWLRENYGCDVVCFTADDLKEEFVRDYIFPCLRAGAIYERKYLLGTAMARPLMAKTMVEVAKEVGADGVQFELTFFALNSKLSVVAPWREWDITGREEAIDYAEKHKVPVPVTRKSIYSRDKNIWHLGHEVKLT
ncbi:hypothetical protein K1719_020230 [Acacia pycnantha]|nr:hypothetical protein K1719_020230 [Acacia pycnantha]